MSICVHTTMSWVINVLECEKIGKIRANDTVGSLICSAKCRAGIYQHGASQNGQLAIQHPDDELEQRLAETRSEGVEQEAVIDISWIKRCLSLVSLIDAFDWQHALASYEVTWKFKATTEPQRRRE